MSKRYFLFFTIATFILTVVWVASNIYHSYATSTIDPHLSTQIQTIPSSFDTAVINQLKTREVVQPNTNTIIISPTEGELENETLPDLTPTITPEPSPSITVVPIQQGEQSIETLEEQNP